MVRVFLGAWLFSWLLLAGPVAGAATSMGNLDIWYDETPVQMGPGSTSWKGKTSIPLSRDDKTGKIKGKGSFTYAFTGEGSGCTITCQATTAMSVAGKVVNAATALDVTAKSTTARCSVRCPRGGAMAMDQRNEGHTEKVTLPAGVTTPVRQAVAGGPGLYYQMAQPCAAEPGQPDTVKATTTPAGGNWEVTWLRLSSLDDIRGRGQPSPNRFGYTAHNFNTKISIVDKIKPARNGDGFCYWVESIDFAFEPIEVAIPGLNYAANSCELREVSKHEEKHVKAYKSLLSSYAKELSKMTLISGLPPPSAPIHIKTEGAGHEMTAKKTDEWVDRLHPEWLSKRDKRDAALDTPAEYSAVKAACPGGWR